jgi:HK97 family phage portal protein
MGLGRLLTRSTRYTATDTVTGATAVFTVIDGLSPSFTSSGSYWGAMGVPGAWRASLLLSDLLGQVPWGAYRQPIGQPEVKLEPTPPLLEQPMPPDTRMTTFSSLALDLIYHGNAFGIIAARNSLGYPTAMVVVPATSVGVRRVTPFLDSPLPVGALEYSVGEMRLGADEVIHIKGPCPPGAVRGIGVLEAHMETLNLASSQQRQSSAITAHGVPTGIITSLNPDLTDGEAQELKAKWMANQSTRTVQVINQETTFTPLSWNPEELQLIEARKFTLGELELIFGLPVGWLGGMPPKAYSNIEMDAVNLLKFHLNGHLARFEQTLSLAFPRGTQVRANMDAVLRSDTLTRYQAHEIALKNQFMSVDEVREVEHRAPLPDKPAELDPFAAEDAGQDPSQMPMMDKPPPKKALPAGGGGK